MAIPTVTENENSAGEQRPAQPLVISATFTAEPIEESLSFWLRETNLDYAIEFAPYNQVFQSLLDPTGPFASNTSGLNIALIRWQDLGDQASVEKNARELIDAVRNSRGSQKAQLVIATCPASPAFLADAANRELIQQLDAALESELAGVAGVHVIGSPLLGRYYPVADYYDAAGEKLGHVPYTAAYFAALAAMLVRRIEAFTRNPHKVIVLDCDNTLWRGIIGEDGPEAVEISEGFRALQEFMIEQYNAGMLLCIASKNNEDDVWETFRLRTEMPLKREHIVTARINWNPKSLNIRELAQELNLGLDSFIFIDDNPKECAEMQANCPEVLTLLLPEDPAEIPAFLQHVWAFDHWNVTSDDKNRSTVYVQKLERERLEKTATSIADFIAGLNLQIDIGAVKPEQMPRVSQLTQRTNQFNCTTIRRTEADIEALLRSGYECITVDVTDRFGSYGLVGVVIYNFTADALAVNSFMLSCRALGRGVEHRIINYLGEVSGQRGLARVDIAFAPTAKNQPARSFLESIGKDYEQPAEKGSVFRLPSDYAAKVTYDPAASVVVPPEGEGKKKKADDVSAKTRVCDFARIAREFNTTDKVLARLAAMHSTTSREIDAASQPRNDTQRKLVRIWAETLGLESVGIYESFFDLGGTSLLAVTLVGRIIRTFGKENLTLSMVLQAPTVEQFAPFIEFDQLPEYQCLVPMRPNGTRPPFYCVHGAGGNVLSLRDLAFSMPDDQPFYCLQAKGLDGSEPFHTVEETAAYYVEEIRRFQPQGPYYIGGGCYGGLVAFEMARILEQQGHVVGLLALIDSYNFAYGTMIPKPKMIYCNARFVLQRGMHHIGQFAHLDSAERKDYLARRIRTLRRYQTDFVNVLKGEGKSQVFSEAPKEVKDTTGNSSRFHEILNRMIEQNEKAQREYVPKPFHGPVALFKATEGFIEPYQDRYLGWGPVAKGGIEDFTIPGDHINMMGEPHVHVLAEKLAESLVRAESRHMQASATKA